MGDQPISRLSEDFARQKGPHMSFFLSSRWAVRQGTSGISDFVVGNPHETPLPEIEEALRKWATPKRADHFAYKLSEPPAQKVVAESLLADTGIDFQPTDIAMTPGSFGAMPVAFRAVMDPDDELIYPTPGWFFYPELAQPFGVKGVPVELEAPRFDLDPEAIAEAITPKTRMVLVNSPHNPTGRIYQPQELERLGQILGEASEQNGRAIYLLSDESYRRIRFDDHPFHCPASYYPRTFVAYTYGKTLLAPGQRIGYLAVPPDMPDKGLVMAAIVGSQITGGWAFPNALMQHALGDLEDLSIDIKHLQSKRDRMVDGLRAANYELDPPEGTFYLLVKVPDEDETAFVEALAERDVFVLPGTLADAPGYFRISLTATDEMIDRALPVFAEVRSQ